MAAVIQPNGELGEVPISSSSAVSRPSSMPMCLYGTTRHGQGAWSIRKLDTPPPLQHRGGVCQVTARPKRARTMFQDARQLHLSTIQQQPLT